MADIHRVTEIWLVISGLNILYLGCTHPLFLILIYVYQDKKIGMRGAYTVSSLQLLSSFHSNAGLSKHKITKILTAKISKKL